MSSQEDIADYVQKTATSTATLGATYIMLALSLLAALAWMSFVRFLIKEYVTVPGTAGVYLFVYAVAVTLLAAIVYSIFTRYATIPAIPIIGVVA